LRRKIIEKCPTCLIPPPKDTPPQPKSQVFVFPIEPFVSTSLPEVYVLRKINRLDFAERFIYIGVANPGFVPNFF
jgi:hypothetical protein